MSNRKTASFKLFKKCTIFTSCYKCLRLVYIFFVVTQINNMDDELLHDIRQNLYNTDAKNIETNLEKFIQKKEEQMLKRRNNFEE